MTGGGSLVLRAKVVAARRKLRQATVKLSLYLRDGDGNPRRVSAATATAQP